MNRRLQVGDPVIVCYADRPCASMVAVLTRVGDDGRGDVEFLDIRFSRHYGAQNWLSDVPLEHVTHVFDFGVMYCPTDDLLNIEFKKVGPSIAQTAEGTVREWNPQPQDLLVLNPSMELTTFVRMHLIRFYFRKHKNASAYALNEYIDHLADDLLNGHIFTIEQAVEHAEKIEHWLEQDESATTC